MKGRGAPPLWICLRPRTTGIRPCKDQKYFSNGITVYEIMHTMLRQIRI